jgi:hypothetical protein
MLPITLPSTRSLPPAKMRPSAKGTSASEIVCALRWNSRWTMQRSAPTKPSASIHHERCGVASGTASATQST